MPNGGNMKSWLCTDISSYHSSLIANFSYCVLYSVFKFLKFLYMKNEHYEKIIKKVKIFVGKIDGDDVNEILCLIGDLVFEDTSNKYFDLINDLHDIVNAMWCEYGLDYGKTQNWDDIVLKILEIFKDGYNKCDEDLTKLITTIEGGIQN